MPSRRRTPPPPRRSTPEKSQEEDNQGEEEEEEDDSELLETEPPITIMLEIKRIVANVKGRNTGAKTQVMADWTQPNNSIDSVELVLELGNIKRDIEEWLVSWCGLHKGLYHARLNTINIHAEVSCRGITKDPFIFEIDYLEEATLQAVYEKVRALWREKAKDIRWIIIETFQARAKTPPPALASQSTPDSSRKRTRSEGATERQGRWKQAQRDADRATGNHIGDIHQEWTCHNKHCPNWNKVCFVESGDHISLDSSDLQRWSEGINAGNASLKNPPDALFQSLMYRRLKKTLHRQKKKAKVDDELPKNAPFVINFGTSPGRIQAEELRSSPPTQEGHDFDNVQEYLVWLVKQGLVFPEHAEFARVGLRDQGFGFNSLREVSDGDWLEMGVKKGAMLAIRRNQKVWQQYLVQERVFRRRQSQQTQEPVDLTEDTGGSDSDNEVD
ncbi:hypothetical protein PMZ80_011163 [Knufia obscura]|uniref:SAM domain-containing protein n=2 Tax=Trichomeriaceae TaxID=1233474 RepID=A0ABR0K0P6_9EURO|nr:hypothetical protein LTR24_008223 [Lithohypha guttulata]KAK5097842.1 hypothetical protein LTS08_006597 [Lithohypha guttulata]KAK5313835.1 hypothetical protein LTR70_007409 [Exophiala xenobiotica]KAK5936598.1 hypothetical protein PMZ80_011163 [Knufia obscura]